VGSLRFFILACIPLVGAPHAPQEMAPTLGHRAARFLVLVLGSASSNANYYGVPAACDGTLGPELLLRHPLRSCYVLWAAAVDHLFAVTHLWCCAYGGLALRPAA
jgi:hypothetical protein